MKVVNCLNRKLPIRIENIINTLIKKIPKEHLKGLERIIITDNYTKDNHSASYLSVHRYNFKFTEIEINLSKVFWPNAYWIFIIPVIPKFIIADVLYHEIGHNYKQMVHGVKQEDEENFAEMYKNTYIDKAFPIFAIIRSIIFAPLYKIITLIGKKTL